MDVSLLCGETHIDINVPDNTVLLNPTASPAQSDPAGAVREAIENPIQSPPLAELAKGRKDACIVISDITRPVPNHILLPPILDTLESSGIPRDKIKILISTGMHRPNLGEELRRMVGQEIMDNYNIINHYCRKEEDLRLIDTIDGAPIEINRHYLDADLKILTGLIEPHMYAGYSGGRKSILPGISSFTTMTHMHSFRMIDQPGVTNCRLDGNPFHEAGIKVCKLAGVDFIANVVINKARDIVGIFAGHYDHAHLAGCKLVRELASRSLKEEVDLVVTSAGGYPLDATFYQVSKGLIAARNIVKKGGTIIVACECREGLGSEEYTEMIMEGNSPDQFFEKYSDPGKFEIDQWCLQTTYQALDHAGRIYVYSPHLSAAEVEAMGMIKTDDIQNTLDTLLPTHEKLAVAPEGPYVVGLLENAV
ncbi:MAG: nickel-dependent lactate racemase [Desulfobacterales bacterium]|nr:nickel-dependent lactate racemase [Desulfobacterales bacterium]